MRYFTIFLFLNGTKNYFMAKEIHDTWRDITRSNLQKLIDHDNLVKVEKELHRQENGMFHSLEIGSTTYRFKSSNEDEENTLTCKKPLHYPSGKILSKDTYTSIMNHVATIINSKLDNVNSELCITIVYDQIHDFLTQENLQTAADSILKILKSQLNTNINLIYIPFDLAKSAKVLISEESKLYKAENTNSKFMFLNNHNFINIVKDEVKQQLTDSLKEILELNAKSQFLRSFEELSYDDQDNLFLIFILDNLQKLDKNELVSDINEHETALIHSFMKVLLSKTLFKDNFLKIIEQLGKNESIEVFQAFSNVIGEKKRLKF